MDSQNPNYEFETEETEDTLSLCDLSIYTDSTSDTEKSLNSSFSSSDHDFFEFSNENCIPSHLPEIFVFCGKLITHNTSTNLRSDHQSNGINRGLIKRDSFNSNLNDSKRRKDLSISPSWSRWQLFVFGLAKLPTEVEVGYSPKPRNRRNSPAVVVSGGGGGGGEKEEGCKRRRKGLWGLVRDLACSRHRRVRLPS